MTSGKPAHGGAFTILVVGLAAVGVYNLWTWRSDRRLARRLRADLSRPRPPLPRTPKVSILVAAWNEGGFIERHMRSILALRYPNKEYVLCAGGTDDTLEIARHFAGPGLQVLEQQPGEGKQRALQRAFERCSGEIIYLTDADCLLDDECFERVLEPVIEGTVAAASAGGLQPLPEQADSPFVSYQWNAQVYASARRPHQLRGLLGANSAVARNALVAAGGFEHTVATGTDYHLAKRLVATGAQIWNVGTGLAATEFPASWRSFTRQQSRWLRNIYVHGPRFGAHAEVLQVARTSAVGVAMLTLPLFALWLGPLPLYLWLIAFAQAYVSKFRYRYVASAIARRPHRQPDPLRLAAYTLREFLVWVVPLAQLVVPRWRHRW